MPLPNKQAYIMRWDEKCARENCTRISVCAWGGGGGRGGGGRYRCININDSIKIKKKRIGGDRVEILWWSIILLGGVLICNLGESRECGVSVASLRSFFFIYFILFFYFLFYFFFFFFVLVSFLSTFLYLYLFVIIYYYNHFSFFTLTTEKRLDINIIMLTWP